VPDAVTRCFRRGRHRRVVSPIRFVFINLRILKSIALSSARTWSKETSGASNASRNRFPQWPKKAFAHFHFGPAGYPKTRFCTVPMVERTGNRSDTRLRRRIPALFALTLALGSVLILGTGAAVAQGGPPYYTNDPGTPGHLNWEINLGYMPFLYSDQSVSHTPDVDINFGVGDRIQLTYENAWLRVHNPGSPTAFGLGQSNPGVKWRFYDGGEDGLNISVFPQLFLNNPNDAVRRGITPANDSFLLPLEFSRKFGPVDVDYEFGYQAVHKGPDGWLTGLVVGHEFTPKLELDAEFYAQGTFHPSEFQPTIDFGARYKIHSPVILLLMAGRSLEPARSNQSYFVGYFGLQFLLPPKSYK